MSHCLLHPRSCSRHRETAIHEAERLPDSVEGILSWEYGSVETRWLCSRIPATCTSYSSSPVVHSSPSVVLCSRVSKFLRERDWAHSHRSALVPGKRDRLLLLELMSVMRFRSLCGFSGEEERGKEGWEAAPSSWTCLDWHGLCKRPWLQSCWKMCLSPQGAGQEGDGPSW